MATGLQLNLNRVIGRTDPSTFLDKQGAAKIWANVNLLNANLATGTDTLSGGLTGIGVYTTSPSTTTTSNDYAQQGTRSIKLTPTTGITSISVGALLSDATYTPVVKPNTTYTLSVYYRTAIAISDPVSLVVTPREVLGTPLGIATTIATSTVVGNTGWTKLMGQFTTASNHNYLPFRATVTASGANLDGRNYYFDTFSLQEGSADGTTNLDLVGALNVKAGTTGLGLNAVCNRLAGTTNLDADRASEYFS